MYDVVGNVRGHAPVKKGKFEKPYSEKNLCTWVAVLLEISSREVQVASPCSLLLRTAGYGLRTGSEEMHGLLGDWLTGGAATVCTELKKNSNSEWEGHGLLGDWRTGERPSYVHGLGV